MSCDFIEQVSLLVDGELAANEVRAVELHLATCAECRQARADFLSLRREINTYAAAIDPLAQRRALAQVLAGQGRAVRSTTPHTQGWRARLSGVLHLPRFNPALAGALALLVVACAVAFIFYRNTQHNVPVIANAPTRDNQRMGTPMTTTSNTPSVTNANNAVATNNSNEVATGATRANSEPVNNVAPKRVNVRGAAPRAGVRSASAQVARVRRAQPARVPREANEIVPSYVAVNATNTVDATSVTRTRPVDAETLTARHVEQSELLLRAFRNARADEPSAGIELSYEKRRAQQLLYQNIVLRREAAAAGNVQVAALLDSLEPILLDIANLPAHAQVEDVRAIKARVQRQNLVALLQVNSNALARAYD